MGANRSYDMTKGCVPESKRSHIETGHRILGHKVLLQKGQTGQSKNIMNSNSDSPIYLIGHERKDGSIEIHSVNIFEGHLLKTEVNLKYDSDGKLLTYNGKEDHTHSHTWVLVENGNMNRLSFGTHEAIPDELKSLLEEIQKFNHKKHHIK